jgi:peptide deformylase
MPTAHNIWTVHEKKEESFLRNKTKDFDFKKFTKKEVEELVRHMRRAMKDASGVGLSANQIGLGVRVFVGAIPQTNGGVKFYTAFNPKIEKESKNTVASEEGCLSVPGTYGMVERAERVTLVAQDKNGKPFKIKALGLTARMFQHEVDHLNGKLFIDKATGVHEVAKSERLQEREEKLKK